MDEETGDEILADLLEAQLLHFESSDEGSLEKGILSDLSTITAAEQSPNIFRVGAKRERSNLPDDVDEGDSAQENVQVICNKVSRVQILSFIYIFFHIPA